MVAWFSGKMTIQTESYCVMFTQHNYKDIKICMCFLPFKHFVGDAYFEDPIEAIESEVQQLESMGVNKIIVLGHSVSFAESLEVAQIPGVDILVMAGVKIHQCSCKFSTTCWEFCLSESMRSLNLSLEWIKSQG